MAGAMAGTAILDAQLTESLQTVTLTINNDCNLSCPHCYLQYESERSVINDDLISFVCNHDFKHLAIVGKEPLYNSASLAVCEKIAKLAATNCKTVSLITNGLNLSLINPSLLKSLSYIDLSLDGGPRSYSKYRQGSLSKILSGLEHLRRNGFTDVNALHVLSTATVSNVDDMMRVNEFFDFRRVMFSPYVPTSNFGTNAVNAVDIEELLFRLSESELFMTEPKAVLLVGTENVPLGSGNVGDVRELAEMYGMLAKIHYVAEDPLLYGIIRMTFDGYVLTPYQSLHTVDYRDVGYDLSNVDLCSVSLDGIYQNMRMGHDHIPLCN
jgi:hypothetical protein